MTSAKSQTAGPSLDLLGGVALHGVPAEGAERLLTQSKVVALLACLTLAAPAAFARRDRLVGLLWPELEQPHGRAALRKAVHLARSVLGENSIVNRGDERLTLSPAGIWCDTTGLRDAIDRGHLAHATVFLSQPRVMTWKCVSPSWDGGNDARH